MRIALVTTSWPAHTSDPAGHFVLAHARELERNGDEVVILAPRPGGAFGCPGVAARLRENPFRAFNAGRWIASTHRRVAKLRVDRVVAHWCVPCGWPIGTASHARLDVVSHGGDVRLLESSPRAVRRSIVRALAARATSWTFASEDLRAQLLDSLDRETGSRVADVAVVQAPPIQMPDVADAIAARRRELAGLRVAVCVGRLVASKRVDRVIAHVARDSSVDALVVVGDGPERARLEQLARRLAIDARFVGAVDRRDALAWIGSAEVLIHASDAEGLSTVIREAEALKTAVVRLTR
jgi:glycosyltransferase involved in cell wall biosynthesis